MSHTKWLVTLSNFFFIPATMSALSYFVALYYNEPSAQKIFMALTLVCGVVGCILYFSGVRKSQVDDLSTLTLVSIIGWIVVIGFTLIPFIYLPYDKSLNALYLIDNFKKFEDALFEATSGITSTGLSVAQDPSKLPRSLQWWRSLSEWVGGLGILIFASSLMRSNFETVSERYNRENTVGLPTINLSSKYIGRAYLIITLLTFIGLSVSDISTWEALNHSLTAVSTGGFSITNDSLKSYSFFPQSIVLMAIIATSLNFNSIKEAWQNKDLKSLLNHEHLGYIILLSLGIILFLLSSSHEKMIAIFQSSTALGTAGFSTTTIKYLESFLKYTLIVLMFIGGTSNSTAGGIKVYRVVLLIRYLWSKVTERPSKDLYNATVLKNVFLVLSVWIAYYIFSTAALYTLLEKQYSFVDILFESTSALSSVGLSSGIISSESPAAVKYLLCLNMYLGRLEMLPLLYVIFKVNGLGKQNFLSPKQ